VKSEAEAGIFRKHKIENYRNKTCIRGGRYSIIMWHTSKRTTCSINDDVHSQH